MDEEMVVTTDESTDEGVDTAGGSLDEETGADTSSAENEDVAEPQAAAEPPVDVNAIAAAARRKAEEQIKSIDAEYARRFGHLKNPKTGKPIQSQRDYLEALDAQDELKAKEQLQQSGVDPALLDNFIANNPAVRQAQEVMAQAQQMQTINQINADIAELGRLDPSITSLETVPPDVINMSMQRNMSLVDAYKIVNFGKVSGAQQAAITQQAINQAKGKSHLNPVNGVSTPDEGAEIPPSELEMWKDMFPDKSSKDLRKLYNQTLT